MKLYKVLILLTFWTQSYAQNKSFDTLRLSNDTIIQLTEIDYLKKEIFTQRFDTLGILLSEGTYKIVDSIKCFKCLEHYSGGKMVVPEYIFHTNYYFSDSIRNPVIPIKELQYDTNGSLSKLIEYEPLAYEYSSVYCPKPFNPKGGSGPCPSGNTVDFLIKKIEYYNSNGELFKKEEYENGLLHHKIQYKAK